MTGDTSLCLCCPRMLQASPRSGHLLHNRAQGPSRLQRQRVLSHSRQNFCPPCSCGGTGAPAPAPGVWSLVSRQWVPELLVASGLGSIPSQGWLWSCLDMNWLLIRCKWGYSIKKEKKKSQLIEFELCGLWEKMLKLITVAICLIKKLFLFKYLCCQCCF